MSQVVPKDEAEKLVLSYQPKTIKRGSTEEAQKYVEREDAPSQDFNISPIVAEASGIAELKRKKMDEKIEAGVLERIKEIQEDAYQKAYELGLKEGTEKAFAEASERLNERLSKLDELLADFDRVKEKVLKENESAFIKLIFEIAEKVAYREINSDQEPILKMLTSLVEGMQKDDQMVIRLSQDDFDFINEIKEKSSSKTEDFDHIKLVVSDKVETGGCVLETNFGSIDATIPERVKRTWGELDSKRPNLKGHQTDLAVEEKDDGSDPESE